MQTLKDFVKKNRTIIIVALLAIVLIGVLLFSTGGKSSTPTFSSTEKSQTEQKLSTILSSIEGVGNTDVMINESDGVVLGVVIVSEGADSIMVKSDILNAVSTALNIDKKIIVIYSMKN